MHRSQAQESKDEWTKHFTKAIICTERNSVTKQMENERWIGNGLKTGDVDRRTRRGTDFGGSRDRTDLEGEGGDPEGEVQGSRDSCTISNTFLEWAFLIGQPLPNY